MKTVILMVVVLLPSCAENGRWLPKMAGESGTRITPGVFNFKEIVPKDRDGGGWRAVCIRVRFGQAKGYDPDRHSGHCLFGVGVPISNRYGHVGLRQAQEASADTGNEAAYFVLERMDLDYAMSGQICEMIKHEWNRRLGNRIWGAQVVACTHSSMRGAPVVNWP